jgi:hypothetical protein
LRRYVGSLLISNQISRPRIANPIQQAKLPTEDLALLDQPNYVLHRPQLSFDPSRHCGRYPERLVNANEVVPERIKRDHVSVVFELLAECVCKAGETPHGHSHREVRPLCIGCADVLRIGIAGNVLCARSDAL